MAKLVNIVTPENCALLIALPLTWEEFQSDLALQQPTTTSSFCGDYAHSVARRFPDARTAWEMSYSRVAQLCNQLIEIARKLGVRVIKDARISDIRQSIQGRSVLIILAHWRDETFHSSDFLCGLDGILKACSDSLSPLGLEISHILQMKIEAMNTSPDGELIAQWFQEEVLEALTLKHYAQSSEPTDWWAKIRAREEINVLLSSILMPGNRLELRDGYHSADKIADQIPQDWRGTIDLEVCCSDYLASVIKWRAHDRRMTISNVQVKQPLRCITELCDTLACLNSAKTDYSTLRQSIYKKYSTAKSVARRHNNA